MPDETVSWEELIFFVYPIFEIFGFVHSGILIPIYDKHFQLVLALLLRQETNPMPFFILVNR